MSLTLTNSTLSTTYDSTEVDANFANITSKFNGNIINADVNSSAAIAASKLAYRVEHLVLTKTWEEGQQPFNAGGWPATATVLGYLILPGYGNGTDWVVTDVEWACTDTGAGAATFDINFGDMSTASFSGTSILSSDITITNNAGAEDSNAGQGAISGTTYTCAFDSTNTKMFQIITSSAADATTLSAGNGYFSLSILLRRTVTSA